jgi:hypothetical protein
MMALVEVTGQLDACLGELHIGLDAVQKSLRSLVRVPIRLLYFIKLPNYYSRTMVLGFTQPLQKYQEYSLG